MSSVTDFIAQLKGARVSANIEPMQGDIDNFVLALQQLEAGVTPTGPAGGDLAGIYPNPSVAALRGHTVKNIAPVDGNVLTWVGAQNDWEPLPAAAAPPNYHPGYNNTRWYLPLSAATGPALISVAAGTTMYAMPLFVGKSVTLDGLAAHHTTGSAGGLAHLGLYKAVNGQPGPIEIDAGTIALDVAGFKSITGLAHVLAAGWYFGVLLPSVSVNFEGVNGNTMYYYEGNAGDFSAFGASITGAQAFGALPANFPAVTYGTAVTPLVGFKIA